MSPWIPEVHLPSSALLLAFTACPIKCIWTNVVNCWWRLNHKCLNEKSPENCLCKGWEDKGPWILLIIAIIWTFLLASIGFFSESCKLLVLFLIRRRSFKSTCKFVHTSEPDLPELPSPAPPKSSLTPGMRISHPTFCQHNLCPNTPRLCSCPSPAPWAGNHHVGQDWYLKKSIYGKFCTSAAWLIFDFLSP